MKKTLLASLALSLAVGAFAQGTVVLNNNGTGYRAPIYFPQTGASSTSLLGNTATGTPAGTQVYTGGLLTGSGFTGQLFSGAPGTTDFNLLVAASSGGTVTFRSGSAAGFTSTSTATLANVAKDAASAVFQIRVWDNSSGLYASWAAAKPAWDAGLISAGMGNLFTVSAIGGDLNTPPSLVGQQSFNVYLVPEPGTFVLAGLAAASLLIFRRRK